MNIARMSITYSFVKSHLIVQPFRHVHKDPLPQIFGLQVWCAVLQLCSHFNSVFPACADSQHVRWGLTCLSTYTPDHLACHAKQHMKDPHMLWTAFYALCFMT